MQRPFKPIEETVNEVFRKVTKGVNNFQIVIIKVARGVQE